MLDEKDLQAIAQLINVAVGPMNERLDRIQDDIGGLKADIATLKNDIAILKEDSTITRTSVNTLLDWAEEAQIQVQIPLFKKAE